MKQIQNIQKKQIITKMNNYFGYEIVKKLKSITFEDDQNNNKDKKMIEENKINTKYINKLLDFKNDKIKKSLIELSKLLKNK